VPGKKYQISLPAISGHQIGQRASRRIMRFISVRQHSLVGLATSGQLGPNNAIRADANSQPATHHSTQFLCPCLLSLFALRVERQVPDKGGRRDTFLSAASLCAPPSHSSVRQSHCCAMGRHRSESVSCGKKCCFPHELCFAVFVCVIKSPSLSRAGLIAEILVALFTVCSNP
jgi:hypothetical protein